MHVYVCYIIAAGVGARAAYWVSTWQRALPSARNIGRGSSQARLQQGLLGFGVAFQAVEPGADCDWIINILHLLAIYKRRVRTL